MTFQTTLVAGRLLVFAGGKVVVGPVPSTAATAIGTWNALGYCLLILWQLPFSLVSYCCAGLAGLSQQGILPSLYGVGYLLQLLESGLFFPDELCPCWLHCAALDGLVR